MLDIVFTEADYKKMEEVSTKLLGWSLEEKCGISIKAMILDPYKAKQAILLAKNDAGFIDRIKLNRILSYLKKSNWKEVLRKKLG